jgi:hypothetical protein
MVELLKEGVRAFDDFTETMYKSAMFITMFSDTSWGNALKFAGKSVEYLKIYSTDAMSSMQDLIAGLDELAQHGVFISARMMRSYTDFADFVAMIAKTTGSTAVQVRQEIQSLFEGTLRAGNTTLRFLKNYMGAVKFKEFINELQNAKDKTERIAYVMNVFANAMRKIKEELKSKDFVYSLNVIRNEFLLMINYSLQLASVMKGLSKDTNIFANALNKALKNTPLGKFEQLWKLLDRINREKANASLIEEYNQLVNSIVNSGIGDFIINLSTMFDYLARGVAYLVKGFVRLIDVVSQVISIVGAFYDRHKELIRGVLLAISVFIKYKIALFAVKFVYSELTFMMFKSLNVFKGFFVLLGGAIPRVIAFSSSLLRIREAFMLASKSALLFSRVLLTRVLLPFLAIEALVHRDKLIKFGESIINAIALGMLKKFREVLHGPLSRIILMFKNPIAFFRASPDERNEMAKELERSIILSMDKMISSLEEKQNKLGGVWGTFKDLIKSNVQDVLKVFDYIDKEILSIKGLSALFEKLGLGINSDKFKKKFQESKDKLKELLLSLKDVGNVEIVYKKDIGDDIEKTAKKIKRSVDDILNAFSSLYNGYFDLYQNMLRYDIGSVLNFNLFDVKKKVIEYMNEYESVLVEKLLETKDKLEKSQLKLKLLQFKIDRRKIEFELNSFVQLFRKKVKDFRDVFNDIKEQLQNPILMDKAFVELKKRYNELLALINQAKSGKIIDFQKFGADDLKTAIELLEQYKKQIEDIQQKTEGGRAFFRVFDQYASEIKRKIEITQKFAQVATNIISSFEETTANILYDAMTGKLKSFKDYVNSLTKTILQALSQVLAKILIVKTLGSFVSTNQVSAKNGNQGNIFTSVIGSIANLFGIKKFAEGGIVTKPTIGLIGEAGYPEAVIPLKNGYVPVVNTNKPSQPINIVLNIQAVDAQSFIDWERRTGAISSIVKDTVVKDIQRNGIIRQSIRRGV